MLGGVRRHPRRHRRAHQPAADGERDPGGRVLQDVGRRRRAASACARRTTSTSAWSQASSAAAATRTPPASPSPDRLERRPATASSIGSYSAVDEGLQHTSERMNGVLVVDKPSGPTSHDVVGARAASAWQRAASATPARSIRWRPACCRSSSAAPRGSRSSCRPTTRSTSPTSGFGFATDDLRRAGHAELAAHAPDAPDRSRADAIERRSASSAARTCRRRRRSRRRRSRASRRTSSRGREQSPELKPVQVTVTRARGPRNRVSGAPASESCARAGSTCGRWRTTSGVGSGAARTWRRCAGRAPARSRSLTRCRSTSVEQRGCRRGDRG